MVFEPIWGAPIAWYLFLAGLGGGAFITASLIRWLHTGAHGMRKAGHIIALVAVAVGLILLMTDAKGGLYNPLRFMLLLSNFGSVMTWGVVFLAVFALIALIAVIRDFKGKETPMWLDVTGSVFAVCVCMYTGALLGVAHTFPLWNSALLPILFLVSALSTGVASVFISGAVFYPDELDVSEPISRVHYGLPILEIIMVASLLFITFNNSDAGQNSVANLVSGEYALAFWLAFALIGLVLPLVMETWMLFSNRPSADGASSARRVIVGSTNAGTLVGGFLLRYLIIVAAMPLTIVVAS